ncbi:MAG: OprO/OprP family phosphate-selective porin [Bacteroidales bacterium]|nr:OprO/OprP family phosphate-selective porin [Bacteroidales bacterium]MBR1961184.1 OprO/OprP family phosphate-selective porin [Bacteroidales bacterium]
MKRYIWMLALLLPVLATAQNETLISEKDSIPSLVERIIAEREGGYKIRKIKSNINLEFYTSANAYFTENEFDDLSFKLNRVRLEIEGRLNDHLSYHFRQSFNKYSNPHSVDNLSSSIEYANITWHASDRFNLVAGKQFVALGGYEAYVNALRVREFCEFNNNVAVYQAGIMGVVQFNPAQQLILQVVNNRSGSDSDLYIYGRPDGIEAAKIPLLATVNWNGFFLDDALHFRYSASMGQLAKGKNIYYLTCGNIYEKYPFVAYLDVMYSREGIDSQQRITTLQGQGRGMLPVTAQNTQYLSFIANLDYQFHPKWNAYIKGAYETASIYEANSIFAKGRYLTSWNAQACLEWFPFTEDKGFKVFAHYLYKGHHLTENAEVMMASMPHTQRISLGLVYVIPVL